MMYLGHDDSFSLIAKSGELHLQFTFKMESEPAKKPKPVPMETEKVIKRKIDDEGNFGVFSGIE